MRTQATIAVIAAGICLSTAVTSVHALQPQIPTLQVCNLTKVQGKAAVQILSRQDAAHSGVFTVAIELTCDPVSLAYPNGAMQISINMSDSIVQGLVTAISFEQVTSTGKHSPTAYLNGRCKAEIAPGCRFWMTLADNKPANQRGTPDVIGFLILDGTGTRVAYGTGPVIEGDIAIAPTSN